MESQNDNSGVRCTQVFCVIRILKDFLEKLEICLIFSQIVRKPVALLENRIRDSTEFSRFLELKNFIHANLHRVNRANMNVEILVYLDENLISYSKNILKKEKNLAFCLSEDDHFMLGAFSLLKNITEKRLSRPALSDLVQERQLHKLQRSLGELEKSIAEKEEILRKERAVRNWKIAFKSCLIQKYEEDLAFQKWDNNMRIKQEIVRSSKNIQSLEDSSSSKLKELQKEANSKRITYNKLLSDNLLAEKDAQMNKKKLLFQLQTYLKKYDQNIGEKIEENFQLNEKYEENRKKFNEFLVEYQREEEEFLAIQQQKEFEEQKLFEQKLMVFMMGRAARVIQVRWRRHRRDQKKKSKKGKGKGKKK